MKTLYVSDLDGTLLNPRQKLTDFTSGTLNRLIGDRMSFTFATARSLVTARRVTSELRLTLPAIVYNGTMAIDSRGEFLIKNFFDSPASLLSDLLNHGIFPIVYSFVDGVEKFSYLPDKCTPGMRLFLDSRKGDIRDNPVGSVEDLYRGEIFYFSCIDEPEKLRPSFEKHRDAHRCLFGKDTYTDSQWLEIMPSSASKANAALQLKRKLGFERLVVFGDAHNDLDLFAAADEAYAVGNATDELKAAATAVIGDNSSDGVARWLLEHYTRGQAKK